MKALVCPSLGPAENLQLVEVEPPSAGGGEAVVEVAYAGLNFFDTLIIEGKYQIKPAPPFSPGGRGAQRSVVHHGLRHCGGGRQCRSEARREAAREARAQV